MSYSYIKSVFPNFEISNNYTDKLYNSLDFFLSNGNGLQTTKKDVKPDKLTPIPFNGVDLGTNTSTLTSFAKDVLKNSKEETIKITETKILEPKEQKSEKFEKFEGECKDLDCNAYIKHVINCDKCKELFKKQLSLSNGEYDKQEIMELASYIIFGIFIILLIDYIKKN